MSAVPTWVPLAMPVAEVRVFDHIADCRMRPTPPVQAQVWAIFNNVD